MSDCLFCKIAAGEIPSTKVYEDDRLFAFEDINPAAPTHVLIIPKAHLDSMREAGEEHREMIGDILLAASRIAKERGLSEDGYRIVNNCGEDGGQTVPHLHFHLLGGRPFKWPPGQEPEYFDKVRRTGEDAAFGGSMPPPEDPPAPPGE